MCISYNGNAPLFGHYAHGRAILGLIYLRPSSGLHWSRFTVTLLVLGLVLLISLVLIIDKELNPVG